MTDVTQGIPAVLRTRDLQGWEVVDRDGEKIGTVADVLIDRGGRIRFVDVEYGFPRKHVLLPTTMLEWGEARLILAASRERALALPPYDPSRTLDDRTLAELMGSFPWMYDPEAEQWRLPAADTRVVPLSEAKEFKLQAGAPDPRGWNVFGSDGERAGTVTQLLVDPAALKIRYLDVDVLQDLFLLKDDRHVLVPIERADLKERGGDVWIQGLTAAEIARLPAYTGGAVSPAMEAALGETPRPGT
jgi:sporulation protein YlmC with PRC-barrel domain